MTSDETMDNSANIEKLRRMADSVRKRLAVGNVSREDLIKRLDPSYVQELAAMTDSQAVGYLASAPEASVAAAYFLLSERVDPAALGSVCLRYLGRPEHRVRRIGAVGIGVCLKRTRNLDVSRLLAKIARSRQEPDDIRTAAYGSLVLINWAVPAEAPSAPPEATPESAHELSAAIDWKFVDSFL